MHYKHTQVGKLMIGVIIFLILYFGIIWTITGFDQASAIIILVVLVIVASFSTLTVTIDNNVLKLKFGYGIYSKSYPINNLKSVKTAKNSWWHGWGIRYSFKPKMRIFNVSGYDAVEFITKDNKVFRIGTDEPKKLERAVKQFIR